MTNSYEPDKNAKWWWAAILTIILLFFANAIWNRASAEEVKKDTIPCKSECIIKYIEQQTPKTVRYYVVYKDESIQEIIPVSKSVKDYIEMCHSNGIEPNLGIYLRNGQISSIIRYKRKYRNGDKR